MKKIIIAVDGPAGSGKGTISSALAKEFNLACIDTGALYRAVAYSMIKDGVSVEDEVKAEEYAKMLGTEISFDILTSKEIRTGEVGQGASKVSAIPGVRQALFECQVNFANNPPADKDGSVLDGRDIGTVIAPQADVKLFLTATAEERANRRFKEFQAKGMDDTYESVLKAIKERDERDSNRSSAPLKAAEDAIMLDTSDIGIEEENKKAIEIVLKKIQK